MLSMPISKKVPAVLDLQLKLHGLLKRPDPVNFLPQLTLLEGQLVEHINANSDGVLLTLVDFASTELHQYSSTHALLVTALSHLGGVQIDGWDETFRQAVRFAALTMNISMIELQDTLSQQTAALNDDQKSEIASHPSRSEALLRSLGCTDALWLESVRRHHEAETGALATRQPASQIARMIQRADMFASRISPRKSRAALSASAAAQVAYLDEDRNPDEAGAALIKAVGIYPPGCWVGLGNGELAIVLKRGEKAHCPLVAALVGPAGLPLATPRFRDTQNTLYGVSVSLAPDKIKFRPKIDTLLHML
jgi:HD-GYP domain-containing protein (c-di-GMP phosphodiesterase class II)